MLKKAFISILFLALSLLAEQSARDIKDMSNRTVTLKKEIAGVVTIGGTPAINAFLFAIGKRDLIKNGISDNALKGFPIWKHQLYFFPDLFNLPQVSSGPPDWNPNIETLLSMDFDIGVVNDPITAQNLDQRGINTVVIKWDSPESIKDTMVFMGDLFNKQERAKEYLKYHDEVIAKINSHTNHSHFSKKRAIYVRFDNMTLPMTSTANKLIEIASATAPSSEILLENSTLNIEKLITWNPDVIFVWSQKDVDLALQDKRLKHINAVINKQIFIVPMGAHIWTHFTPEQPLAALWCFTKIYPEISTDIDITKEAREFYENFMDKELSKEQLESILGTSKDKEKL